MSIWNWKSKWMCVQLAGLSRDFDVKKHFVDSILSNKVGFNFEERSINPWIERPSVGSSSLRSLSAPSRSMKPGLVWHILAHTDDISIPFKRGSTQLSIWTHFNIGSQNLWCDHKDQISSLQTCFDTWQWVCYSKKLAKAWKMKKTKVLRQKNWFQLISHWPNRSF